MSEVVPPLRVAVLLSGTGRTLKNLIDWRERGDLNAEIVAVASNKRGVRGLQIAADAGIPRRSFLLSGHRDRADRDRSVWEWIHTHRPDLLLLAGYLSLLDLGASRSVPVLNIHPALLPAHGGEGYYGDRVHRAVLEAGDVETGCTVHVVDDAYDRGRILDQERVPVHEDDDVESLAARVFEAECRLYPRAVNAVARGELLAKRR